MSVDKFGRYSHSSKKSSPILVQSGIRQMADGNFNAQNKRILNLMEPIESGDASNKQYVDDFQFEVDKKSETMNSLINKKLSEMSSTINLAVDSIPFKIESKLQAEIVNIRNGDGIVPKKIDQNKSDIIREFEAFKRRRIETDRILEKQFSDAIDKQNSEISDIRLKLAKALKN